MLTWIIAGAVIALGLGGLAALAYFVPSVRLWLRTSAKDALLRVLRNYIFDNVMSIVEREYAVIAAKVISGELKTAAEIKGELYRLGKQLKDKALKQFADKDLALLGDDVDGILDDMIRFAADRVSPFPGKDTAEAFLTEGVSDNIVNKGISWVRENFLKTEEK